MRLKSADILFLCMSEEQECLRQDGIGFRWRQTIFRDVTGKEFDSKRLQGRKKGFWRIF
jgi:hypothetical protein